jgi:hypothetical protein
MSAEFGPDCVSPSTFVGTAIDREIVDPGILSMKPLKSPARTTAGIEQGVARSPLSADLRREISRQNPEIVRKVLAVDRKR